MWIGWWVFFAEGLFNTLLGVSSQFYQFLGVLLKITAIKLPSAGACMCVGACGGGGGVRWTGKEEN
jgi:hypothetical protein